MSNMEGENTQICILKPAQEGLFSHPLHLAIIRSAGPRDMRPWIIREMRFSDAYQAAFVASRAYHHTKFREFLSPGRRQYPADYVRGFQQKITARMLKANNRSFVAVAVDEPNVPVAYMQCERLGNDEGAKEVIREKKSIWLSIFETVYNDCVKYSTKIWPDRSVMDEADMAIYKESNEGEEKKHWSGRPDRANRWHCRGIVVSQEFQRRGIGKALMNELVSRAENQGVPIQLEASDEGEWLYRSMGFELLDRFMVAFGRAKNQGGVMIWKPKKGLATSTETVEEELSTEDVLKNNLEKNSTATQQRLPAKPTLNSNLPK